MHKMERRIVLSDNDHRREAVVLVHGLFATRRSMRKLAERLRLAGYSVVNWSYPTFSRSIESLANSLLPVVHSLEKDAEIRSFHFVTHSLGGIVARYTISLAEPPKVHRLVMLAPPNGGSHLARWPLGPLAKFLPAIAELSESPDSLPNRIREPIGVECGIIAAASDIIVRVENTTLPYQKDHSIVSTSHFELPFNDTAIGEVISFLKTGLFLESSLMNVNPILESTSSIAVDLPAKSFAA